MKAARIPYIEQLAAAKPARRFFGKIGLDPGQFLLFLRLFRTLSERREYTGILALNQDALVLLGCLLGLSGAVQAISALFETSASPFLFSNLLTTCMLVLLFSMSEAANLLFNPVEAIVLGHNPVHSLTYATAKIAYILVPVIYLVTALCLPSALLGVLIKGTYWIWPLTHAFAAFLMGFTTAFIVCALYGWMVRLVPARFLKRAALWAQSFAFLGFISAFAFVPIFWGPLHSTTSRWTWLPLTWFVNLGMLGCREETVRLGWGGFFAIVATLLVAWSGLRNFSGMYFAESSLIAKGGSGQSRGNAAHSGLSAHIVRAITGTPVGIAAFAFTSKMIRRDWQFRRNLLLPLILIFFSLFILAAANQLKFVNYLLISPFAHNRFSPALIFPNLWSVMTISLCVMIPFTDLHRGSWIFSAAPLEDSYAFAKGVYLALWIPVVGLPHLAILPLLARFWGWTDAALFVAFVLILLSFYLGLEMLLASGLPFSNPFDASKAVFGLAVQMLGGMMIGFAIALQYLLFYSRAVAGAAGIFLTWATCLTLHAVLRHYEKAIRRNLQKLSV